MFGKSVYEGRNDETILPRLKIVDNKEETIFIYQNCFCEYQI